MNPKLLKGAAWLGALAAFGMACILGVKAQQNPNWSKASPMTTNWIGCLVVGKNDTVDPMARGPHPTAVQPVEIGLRSDGVVIWRGAVPSK